MHLRLKAVRIQLLVCVAAHGETFACGRVLALLLRVSQRILGRRQRSALVVVVADETIVLHEIPTLLLVRDPTIVVHADV